MFTEQILRLKTVYKKAISYFTSSRTEFSWVARPAWLGAFLAGSLVPFLALGLFWARLSSRAEALERKVSILDRKARHLAKAQRERERFFKEYGMSDERFLADYVETEQLLTKEVQILKEMVQEKEENATYRPILDRIERLTDGSNQLTFLKIDEKKGDFYCEKYWKLVSPVEMNRGDLKKILALIEGVKFDQYLPSPLRPQLFMTKFDLTLKSQEDRNKLFWVDMEILQRGCNGFKNEANKE